MATKAAPVVEAPPEAAPPSPAKGKKKLILIAAAAALAVVLAAGGATTWWLLKKKTDSTEEAVHEGEEAEDIAVAEVKVKKKHDKKHAPVFLPLDMFTVNLADREAERYAQVGITLEVADTKTSDVLKAYMPAVRNDILLLLAHKKASDLQDRAGKVALAREIREAAMKPLSDDGDDNAPDDESPVRAVHFSSFIIQ
jgi:flagellar FliL protein